jgi:hypothetical protein
MRRFYSEHVIDRLRKQVSAPSRTLVGKWIVESYNLSVELIKTGFHALFLTESVKKAVADIPLPEIVVVGDAAVPPDVVDRTS